MSKKNLTAELKKILAKYNSKQGALLPCLHLVQEREGFISEEMISHLAQSMDLPRVEVYSVVTFYSMFTLKKQGKYVIRLCLSLPCYLKSSRAIFKALKNELKIENGETTKDGIFSIEGVSCLGLCDRAPGMLINDKSYGDLTPQKAVGIIRELKKKK
ncbi:MAG: NAD(P)H-dependent oxidoreductase subunit E [Elusimicrobiota bacterium]|nr:NAD(P)H-dependent oxidoreductase subunit E [Elusimicrobiota bacterium]